MNNKTHTIEEQRSIDDRDLPTTCSCGSDMSRVLVGSVGIQFKGTGFYKTDNPK
jgi:predicted nucleic acid-binding Zn ribbon protein